MDNRDLARLLAAAASRPWRVDMQPHESIPGRFWVVILGARDTPIGCTGTDDMYQAVSDAHAIVAAVNDASARQAARYAEPGVDMLDDLATALAERAPADVDIRGGQGVEAEHFYHMARRALPAMIARAQGAENAHSVTLDILYALVADVDRIDWQQGVMPSDGLERARDLLARIAAAARQPMPDPYLGQSTTCRDCGERITYDGTHWRHDAWWQDNPPSFDHAAAPITPDQPQPRAACATCGQPVIYNGMTWSHIPQPGGPWAWSHQARPLERPSTKAAGE